MSFVNLSVPRTVADFFGAEPSLSLRYPVTVDGYGATTPLSVALWLASPADAGGQEWALGDSGDPQGPLAVAKRLLFMRSEYEADYVARGGRRP